MDTSDVAEVRPHLLVTISSRPVAKSNLERGKYQTLISPSDLSDSKTSESHDIDALIRYLIR